MSHANAALTPRQRLRLARQVVDEGWSVSAAADYFRVSYPTAAKWARRYVELGAEGMADRSSRPHSHPNRTPREIVKKIVHLRIKKRLGPVQIAGRLGMAASTVHAVLVRCRLNRLSHVDQNYLQDDGMMGISTMDADGLFGVPVMAGLDKAARLDYGESLMTHAMVFQGVNFDGEGKPTLWRVENSWGKDHGHDG